MISEEEKQRYEHPTFYGSGYIAVDFDFTLKKDISFNNPPITKMLELVKYWMSLGIKVKIFTAKTTAQIPQVKDWLNKYGIGSLEVTNLKIIGMRELWDDRAVTVIPNTGNSCCNYRRDLKIR